MEICSSEKILHYRGSAKKLYWATFILLLLSEFVIIRINLFTLLEGSILEGTIKLTLASTVPISIFLRLVIIVRPRLFSIYKVYDDHLRVEFKKNIKEIDYNDVNFVKFSVFSPRFFGGFTLKTRSGQKLVFLSILKDNYLVLEKVVSVKPDLLPEEKFKIYHQTSQLVDVSWQRIRDKLKAWPVLLAKYFGLAAISMGVVYASGYRISGEMKTVDQLAVLFFGFEFVVLLLAMMVNSLEESFLNKALLVDEKILPRDKESEKKANLVAQVVFFSLYLSAFTLVLSLLLK